MNFLKNISYFIRSLIFTIYLITATMIYSLFCILIKWTTPFKFRYAIIMIWLKAIIYGLKFICGISWELSGAENIPKDRAGIIFSKHQSTWETFFLPTLFPQTTIILKRELLWVPFFGWGLSIIDPIAINRSDRASAMEQVTKMGKEALNMGRWILVFPEGTRIPAGKTGKYRLGGARLASATHAPVIPVAHNAGRHWPKGNFLLKPGVIKIEIGQLIETEGKKPDVVMGEAKNWIESRVKEFGG